MIELKNVAFCYSKKENLFENINLEISEGGIIGLLGKNGAGKTSLMKILAGLVFPTEGMCRVLNHLPKNREPNFLADIFFLQEDLYVPEITGEKFINLYSPFYQRFDHEQLKLFLKEFSIPLNKLLTEFSYGQKKKFLISFGLASNCRIFILDEPTNGLDIPSKAQFRKLLASTASDDKLFIISTHQVHDIENLVDTVIIIDNGDIIFHQNLFQIANHLTFSQQLTKPDPMSCLYSEKNLNGYNVVSINNQDGETYVDLEMLFNAVLNNQYKIKEIFEGKKE